MEELKEIAIAESYGAKGEMTRWEWYIQNIKTSLLSLNIDILFVSVVGVIENINNYHEQAKK